MALQFAENLLCRRLTEILFDLASVTKMANLEEVMRGRRRQSRQKIQDKAATTVVTPRYFTKRNQVPPKSSSQKKKQKKNALITSEEVSEYIDENDDEKSLLSKLESEFDMERDEPKPSLNLGDYINRMPFDIDAKKDTQLPDIQPSKSPQTPPLSWPYIPRLSENPELFYGNFIQPLEWPSMIDYQDYPVSQTVQKSQKSSRGLVDLDMSDPCLPRRPCLLCRMSYGRNSDFIPCYEQRRRLNIFDLCMTKGTQFLTNCKIIEG